MNLGFEEAPAHFESPSQKARIWTEQWVRGALFCPNCGTDRFNKFSNNRPAADFFCSTCDEEYELKSQKARFGAKVVDGAYKTLRERVVARNNPNLLLLRYDLASFGVTDVIVVPKHFFAPGIIERRKPLALTARRAGWVGCNILLGRIPEAGKIYLVRDRQLAPKGSVLETWRRTLFLRKTSTVARGWLMEVMSAVDGIGHARFNLDEVYAAEDRLKALYPANQHVRQKIRQQLQVLRDNGYIEFLGRGQYALRSNA